MIEIHDEITEDVSDNSKAPEVDVHKVDWTDKNDVMNAADVLSRTVEASMLNSIVEVAKDPYDGSLEAMLMTVSAYYAAINRLYSSFAPILTVNLLDKHEDWVKELAGADKNEDINKYMPDLKALHEAQVKSKALDDAPVIVHLSDADRDVQVEGDRMLLVFDERDH